VNFLHRVRKLTENVRHGSRHHRRYDAAQTPYRRLLSSSVLLRKAERQLATRSAAINPLRLKLELESAQRTLAEPASIQSSRTHFGRKSYEATSPSWSIPIDASRATLVNRELCTSVWTLRWRKHRVGSAPGGECDPLVWRLQSAAAGDCYWDLSTPAA